MSFFGNAQGTGTYVVSESLDELMQNSAIKESAYDNFIEGAFAIVAEAEANNTAMMTAIGINEYAHFEQTGEQIVYTEGMISSVWNKVKEIIQKIWNKIKELFKRFVAMFDKFFAGDKEFVKKYRAKVLAADTSDLEFTGYPFSKTVSKLENANFDKVFSELDLGSGSSRTDAIDKAKDAIRQVLAQASSPVDASEFMDALKELYYGATEKESLDGEDLSATRNLGYIENYNTNKKGAEKLKRESDKFFNKLIKACDDEIKTASKGDDKGNISDANKATVEAASDARAIYQFSAGAVSTAIGVALNSLKDRNRQGRAFCVKAMSKGGSFKQESANIGGDDFLAGVKFI